MNARAQTHPRAEVAMMLLHRPLWANQQLLAPDRRPTLGSDGAVAQHGCRSGPGQEHLCVCPPLIASSQRHVTNNTSWTFTPPNIGRRTLGVETCFNTRELSDSRASRKQTRDEYLQAICLFGASTSKTNQNSDPHQFMLGSNGLLPSKSGANRVPNFVPEYETRHKECLR